MNYDLETARAGSSGRGRIQAPVSNSFVISEV